VRYRWVVLAAGTAAQAGMAAVFLGVPVLAPALRDEFDLSISEVGLAVSSLWIGPILTLLGWGLLADRFGERLVLASGLGACAVLSATAGLAGDFTTFLLLILLAGGAGSSVNAASARAVMQWFPPEERGFALGIRQTAIPFGGGFAALTLPFAERAAGIEAAFGLLGAYCLVSALVAALLIREAPARDTDLEPDAVAWTLRDRRLWALTFGSALYLFAQMPVLSFTVLFLHDVHGLSETAAAGVLVGCQVGAAVGRISAGRLSDRLGNRLRPLRWIGLASASILLLTALLARASVPVIVVTLVFAAAISMSWNGLSLTAAAELAGRARSGAAIGFQQTMLSVVGVGVPIAFAAIVEATSWRTAFAVSAFGPLVGWWVLGRLPERVMRPGSQPQPVRSS
jgi:sugar phosphate permease